MNKQIIIDEFLVLCINMKAFKISCYEKVGKQQTITQPEVNKQISSTHKNCTQSNFLCTVSKVVGSYNLKNRLCLPYNKNY